MRILFWFWYTVGLGLMLFWEVPDILAFSNGLFLLFFGLYAIQLERQRDTPLPRLIVAVTGVIVATYLLETIGTRTGFPFGAYQYTDTLGLGLTDVPLPIAFAWVGVMITALYLSTHANRWKRALEVGVWAVTLDLVLDPVAFSREFWLWENPGIYYGIPFQNFVGWFVTAFLLSFLFPLRQAPLPQRMEAVRLYQGILLMFGALAFKDGLFLASLIACIAILTAQGRVQLDSPRRQSMVQ